MLLLDFLITIEITLGNTVTIQKIITLNNYKNGTLIINANKFGDYDKIEPAINKTSDLLIQSGVLNGRFDDYIYYTA